jgi:cytochrome c553
MPTRLRMTNVVVLAIAVAVAAGHSYPAAAQSANGSKAVMRPLFATAVDIADGKQLANMSCASCHGVDGISSVPDVPYVAGQRPAYLYEALKDYRSGARNDVKMTEAIKFLSDDAMVKVAAYYASLDPASPPAKPPGPVKLNAEQVGKGLAAACAGCHGNTGVSQIPGIPSLAGLDPKYVVGAMQTYKSGQRKHDTMKAMVASLSDSAMNDVALFYGLQKPERTKTPAAGDRAAGKAAVAACAGCHGEGGVSASPDTPSLAGQDAEYTVAALTAYKDGARANDTMKGIASSLDKTAMKNIAAYYAAQQPKAPNVRAPLTVTEWTERCNRCHGANGNSTDPRFPMLASQKDAYLKKALQEYQAHKRKSHEMGAMAGVLSEADIANLAAFYAHQKARAVLFVPVPAK